MKRTKIVCTIGPASDSDSKISALIKAGMNVARMNLSHNIHEYHARVIKKVRVAGKKAKEPVAIIADLQGPKIRVGDIKGEINFKKGDTIEFPVTLKGLDKGVKKKHRVLIADGIYEGKVVSVASSSVKLKMSNSGTIVSHKGLNFPDSKLEVSSITAKDKKDLVFAIEQGADWIALSFVTSPKDVEHLQKLIAQSAGTRKVLPRIIVKIERKEAVARFKEILEVADGVMIARGDLGLEIRASDVPLVQKKIIELCRLAGKPVIVATQMLASMEENSRPTRAEVSDVANAVCDHTDAVMLSGETATGKYPIEAVKYMSDIIIEAEESPYDDVVLGKDEPSDPIRSVAYALKVFAQGGHIDGVICSHDSVAWSEQLLMARPEIPLFLATANETIMRQANLRWGVQPFYLKGGTKGNFEKDALNELKKQKLVQKGMRLIVMRGLDHKSGFDIVSV
ncbi:MAG: pyruvate kinase [Patescibacteria group bacterium]